MSETLLLLNPRKRGTKKRRVKRNPIGAYVAGGRKVMSNPKRRHHKRRHVRRNPIAVARRRVGGGGGGIVNGAMGLLKPAIIGASGALAVDTIMQLAPIPPDFREGMLGVLVKAGVAVAIGTLGKRILGPTAGAMGVGALTVQAHQFASGMLSNLLPSPAPAVAPAPASMGYFSPARGATLPGSGAPRLGVVPNGRMGASRMAGKMGAYIR